MGYRFSGVYESTSRCRWFSEDYVTYLIICQAFEQVVPNERTKVSLSIIDGSILILAPNHPGGMLIGVNELNFETDIISEIKALEFHLTAPGLALLMLDDRGSPSEEPIAKRSQGMLSHWAVSRHLFPSRTSIERGPATRLYRYPPSQGSRSFIQSE